jgi:probable HAF family extracellular repeat protein
MNRTLIGLAAAGFAVASLGVASAATARTNQPGLRPVAASIDGVRQQSPIFVYERGRYTAFDVPFGESAGDGAAINNRGQIVGGYIDPATDCLRGYLRTTNGAFARIDAPAANGGSTEPMRINDRGAIVGSFRADPSCQDTLPARGFVRDQHGRYTTIHVSGAVRTQATGINNRGQVVGDYLNPDGTVHGYRWDHGRVTTIDGPAGASTVTVLDINDRGQMVGVYADAAGAPHGFLLTGDTYTTIDMPAVTFTFPFAINDRGQIAGFTTDALPVPAATDVHGFVLRDGAGGPVTRIDVPGAVIGTVALDINDAGTVVGMYGNPNAGGAGPSMAGKSAPRWEDDRCDRPACPTGVADDRLSP